MTLPPRETLLQTVEKHDSEFNGVFFATRGNTGEFCNPGCKARKSEPKRMQFFETTREALAAGYRPCKKCKPLKTGLSDPEWIEALMAKVESDPAKRWHDYELEAMELDPATVRRWFIANHGFTFHGYTRLRRLGAGSAPDPARRAGQQGRHRPGLRFRIRLSGVLHLGVR